MIQLSSLPAAIPHGPVRAAALASGAAGSFALPGAKTAAAEVGEIPAPGRQILAASGKALPEIDTDMMMMSPTIISLPFKLLLFVLVDGWALTMGSLAASFGT